MADQRVVIPDEGTQRRRRGRAPQPAGGRSGSRSRGGRGGRGGTVALLLLGLPLLGAFVDEAIAPGLGVVFAICAVLGPVAAAALSSRAGWWWVLTAPGPVVLASTAVAELFGNSAKYQGSKALATGAAGWAINGFPVMLAAVGAALVVVLVRIARDRRNRRG
ncbi:hypothetical protein P3T37_001265 [Kitasatospora sp. MAA4]|uniref:DUF6542 domain-containing protein n=1 Tax=Kitasatospora sp. MAA4 TaxID=3035093 RepID=UPI002476080C|nr:DUF6542 domain-containing protein [Kitasatospora sp. MAA4]MDH6131891.1 hypothetical protein [Kitasatospora sp. MAA4]